MKSPYALAALLAVLILPQWYACRNLTGNDAEEDAYNVTYYPNGAVSGSVPNDSMKYSRGNLVIVKDNTGGLAKTGFTFSGWNTKTAGTGTTYAQGQIFAMGNANVTLYARWTTNPTFTVTYNANGATGGTAPADMTNYEAGQAVTVLGNTGSLVKTGYAFAGWNSAADGGGTDRAAGSTFAMGSANVILYAKWTTEAVWAESVSAGSGDSSFQSVAVDGSGNVYAAGYQTGNGTFTYGSKSVTGVSASGRNMVLVKYDSSGTVLWARGVSAGSNSTLIYSVALDGSGYVYTAGYQYGTGSYTYDGQSATGSSGTYNAALVKYDPSTGTAVWARSISAGAGDSVFNSIAVDGSGYLYASGYQAGTGTYTYGTESASGTSGSNNIVLVKYDSSGTAVWARSVSAGSGASVFSSVAVDGSGNVYAAGRQAGTGTYTYGTENATGTGGSDNVVLVKYDSSGTAIWARTVSAGSNVSRYYSVAVDGSANIYAAGYQFGTETYTYGSRNAAGTFASGNNIVLVKYDASGAAIWARTVSSGSWASQFAAVAVDGSGGVYAAGFQDTTETYTYGGQSAAGTYPGNNVILVKYDASGTAIWARTVSAGSSDSTFKALAVEGSQYLYTGGSQAGTGSYTYGGRDAAGAYSGFNAALVKWRP